MKYILLVILLLTGCVTTKELFIDNLKSSYEITSEQKPKIYYLKSNTDNKVKVATLDEIIYGKFGGKLLLTYKLSIHNTLHTNSSEIVAWIFVTHKEVEQVEVKYVD